MTAPRETIGRARTVLVFGQGAAATATTATVLARTCRPAGGRQLRFAGVGRFDRQARQHLSRNVLAVVQSILRRLSLRRRAFEISIVNLAAASAVDVGLKISGFSADTAALLAMLSAALKVPISQDCVVTGHVASSDGDIRSVRSLPAKLTAAMADPTIRRFVHPCLDADPSLESLSPAEKERSQDAILEAGGRIKTMAVADVRQLLKACTSEEAVVRGALRRGFFEPADPLHGEGSPVDQCAAFLTADNEGRFWRALQGRLLAAHGQRARALLRSRASYQVRRKRYPDGFGAKLLGLVRSVPPAVRRLKMDVPLLAMDQSLRLCGLGAAKDHDDVQCLLDAVRGRAVSAKPRTKTPSAPPKTTSAAEAAVAAVLDEISAEALARNIGEPIDLARASYTLERVTVDSYEAFADEVAAFYRSVLWHTGTQEACPQDPAAAADAMALLERAFRDGGGTDGAWSQAHYGTSGGLRVVLDQMTEQYKIQQQGRHVQRALQEAMDPLDWDARVAFMGAFLARLGPQLPAEIRDQPPERYARHYDTILQAYVRSLDSVQQLLRTL